MAPAMRNRSLVMWFALLTMYLRLSSACRVDLEQEFASFSGIDFVCDETVPWLHFSKDSATWAAATPPEGTGCHAYTALAGDAPECSVGAECAACARPKGKVVASVFAQGGSCAACAPNTRRRSRELSRRHRQQAASELR